MTDRILLSGLTVRAFHGVHPEEREQVTTPMWLWLLRRTDTFIPGSMVERCRMY